MFGYLEQLLQDIKARGDSETKAMLELSRVRQVVHDRYEGVALARVCVLVYVLVRAVLRVLAGFECA